MAKPSFDAAQAAAQITRGGYHWGPLGEAITLSYGFRTEDSAAHDGGAGFSEFSAQQIAVAKQALLAWSDVARVSFEQSGNGHTNKATVLFGNFSQPDGAGAAHAYLPGSQFSNGNQASSSRDGDVWVNTAYDYEANPVLWGYGQQTLVHEIGHALGLEHPGDYNAGQGEISYKNSAEYREDTRQYSVMSYWDESNTGADFHKGGDDREHHFYAGAPLMHDIAAAQRLYGANMEAFTGDTVFGFNSNTERAWFEAHSDADPIIFCAWDAGGVDTFDFSGFSADQQIDLRNTHFSNVGGMTGNISISAIVRDGEGNIVNIVENAVGGRGADTLTGNDFANHLWGNLGADSLIGGRGDDVLVGGKGADQLDGGKGRNVFEFDSVKDSKGAAIDTIVTLGTKDVIDLSAIDADTHTSGDQAFHLVSGFSHVAGEAVLSYDAGTGVTTLELDVNGDGKADSRIHINGDEHNFHGFVL
jgi:serralysin